VTFYIGVGARFGAGILFSLPSDWSVYRSEIDPISIVRVAKNNRPIGLNQNIKRKRSEIKWIGRLFCA